MASDASRARAELHGQLFARRAEIEAVVLDRVLSVAELGESRDPDYVEGLDAAVRAAVDYFLAVVQLGEERSPPPPPPLLAQVRLAARSGVSLEAVARCYLAGHSLLNTFLVDEAKRSQALGGPRLQRLLRAQANVLDRLLATVSEEHARELERRFLSSEMREVERIERMIAGEIPERSEFAYDFDGRHVGLIALGQAATEHVREIARQLDCRLLAIRRTKREVWAWLSCGASLGSAQIAQAAIVQPLPRPVVGIGEPGTGLAGWRLTHRQAKTALPIAPNDPETLVCYGEVALIAMVLQDELLTTSLRRLYLEPLEAERDGGEGARRALSAYFAADRNISSAAAALGVSRQAVAKRLHGVEARIGRSLAAFGVELDLALQVERLEVADGCSV